MNQHDLRLVTELSAAFHFRADGPDGRAWLSPAFFELTGIAPQAGPEWRFTDVLHADDRLELLDAWRRAASDATDLDIEVRVTVADGSWRWHRVRARLAGPDQVNGGTASWVGVGLDVHDQRLLARQRRDALAHCARASRQTQVAGQLKAEFLATASHELRTPLNAIAGWLHVLKLRAEGDLQQLHALAALERNVQAEKKLIDNLLDVSRLTRGLETIAPVVIDLVPLVRGCVAHMVPVAKAKGVALHVNAPTEAVLVNADQPKMEQVIRHLLGNAIQVPAIVPGT